MGLDIGGGTKDLASAWRSEQYKHSRTNQPVVTLDESLIFNS